MAADALYTGAPTRAPGNIDQPFTPSRRGMLAGIAGAGVAAALPSIALAAPGRPWDQRLRAYRAAVDAAAAFYATTYAPASAHVDRMAGEMPTLMVKVPARDGRDATISMRLATMDEWAQHPLFGCYTAPVRDAYVAWDKRFNAVSRTIGWTAIQDRMDELDTAEYEAKRALIAEPAPDIEALAMKIRLAMDWDHEPCRMELCDTHRLALVADARRLSGGAAL